MKTDPNIRLLEKQLPFLPGTRFELGKNGDLATKISHSPLDAAIDKGLNHYRKSHAFDYCNGVSIFNVERPGIGGSPLQGQDTSKIHTSADIYVNAHKDEQAESLPAWVAFDRKVLRFYGYFQEAVHESRLEQYRIRKVNIYFYLEDDSIHVSEPRTPSSGLPQGTLIRRHRIPKAESAVSQHYVVSDFNVGKEVTFYSKTFKIVGCDQFTREFLGDLSVQVPHNQEFPLDPYEQHRQVLKDRMRATRPSKKDLGLKRFLENDRRVLRFNCVWDDTSAFGDVREMILHVYLSDDTVEVKEVIPPNSGRDSNTLFLKRCKLPKRPKVAPVNGPIPMDNPNDFYTERDLTIGAVLHFYGRPFTIVDCDEFTKDYYREKYGLENFDPVRIDSQEHRDGVVEYEVPAAPPLIPRPPRKDFKKLMAYDGITLRYSAQLVSNKQTDRDRKFIISYFLADDTISVFEPHQRNSGIVGGKFLERRKFRKDGTSIDPHAENQGREDNYYSTTDLFIGAEMILCHHTFKVVGADDHAIKFMQEHPESFGISQ